MTNFDKNIFINCPFDDDFRQLLLAIIFTTKYLGFTPRLTLESSNSSTTRISKIVDLIEQSKYGIHDLSRMISSEGGEHARMNMPFELGLDYGCKEFKGGKFSSKRSLVLEEKQYAYQAALSDISGSDIKHHNNEPMKVTKAVRDWLVTETLGKGKGSTQIWYDFNDFTADLEQKLLKEGHTDDDFESIPISEVMVYMDLWFAEMKKT